MDLDIPSGFELGVATSSWQIEGDVAGRGRCNWDDFADIPGAIKDGATGEPACDHVHRLEEDLDRLAWLGVDAYRFSVRWPRVMPDGRGEVSASGPRLLRPARRRPARARHHAGRDPVPLGHPERHRGRGRLDRTARRPIAFADYAQVMGEHFAGRVNRWATLNEPWCSAFLGLLRGLLRAGPQGAGRLAGCGLPPHPRPWAGRRAPAGGGRAEPRHRAERHPGDQRDAVDGRCRRAHRRAAEPDLPRPPGRRGVAGRRCESRARP